MGELWNLIILQPTLNSLIALYSVLFESFGLTIIALTIVIRGVMHPLTAKQLRATKAMQSLQPKLSELQKKYAKDKQKLAQEQMRLYKESGVSPAGCMVPMLIQMPIWIALYQSIMLALAVIPENFLNLSHYLYSWPVVYSTLPLGNEFLGMDLAKPNTFLALLVGGTMWLQQKMVMPTSADPKQAAQSRMMLWMMPMMFGFFALSFPSGLSLYWAVSSIISIVTQYYVTGWGGLATLMPKRQAVRDKKYKKRIALQEVPAEEPLVIEQDDEQDDEQDAEQKEELGYETPGDKRQDSGRSYPTRLRAIRHQPRRGRRHRPKRR